MTPPRCLKLGSGNGGRSEDGVAVRRPANADVVQIGDTPMAAPVTAVTRRFRRHGRAATETTFSDAFPRLDTVTDFSLLAVPGEGTTAMVDLGMAYCANRPLQDVFYIGETASHDDTRRRGRCLPQQAHDGQLLRRAVLSRG